jgi:hypothetical protein
MVKFPIKGSADEMLEAEGINSSAFDCAGCKIPDGAIPPSEDGTEPSGVVTEIAGCLT